MICTGMQNSRTTTVPTGQGRAQTVNPGNVWDGVISLVLRCRTGGNRGLTSSPAQ